MEGTGGPDATRRKWFRMCSDTCRRPRPDPCKPQGGTHMTAELILRNGRFTTLDRSNPTATAVAVEGGRFTAVGRDADVMPQAGPDTRIIDLRTSRALPGLIDNHLHII